jgi:7,8-dihydropterin-6-yl-methyl-4-(beta-D-ribofuranosyl)aminobenzene 5'-phosphate synthase
MLLHASKSVSATVLIDNYIDHFLLEKTEAISRPLLSWEKNPVAEHGLSVLIEVENGEESHTILLDAGLSDLAFMHNIDVLQVDLEKIESIVLSHGHMDHIGGLVGLLEKLGRPIDLLSHPGAYCQRRLNLPGKGPQKVLPALDKAALQQAGAHIVTTKAPALLCSDLLLTLGEIKRDTAFEQGFPWAEISQDAAWKVDPFVDDQAVVANVKDKGLVIISGCAHSGIINTVRYAQEVTGVKEIFAVMGGFHMTGPLYEPIIDQTVSSMKELAPTYIIPMHCTGWKSTHAFATAMPEQFIMSSVGTKFIFS